MGSIRDARLAGAYPARSDETSRSAAAQAITDGSPNFTPNRKDLTAGAKVRPHRKPAASPMAVNVNTSRMTIHMTLPLCAPSAILIPISLVLRDTA